MNELSEATCHQCGGEADGEMDGKLWCAGCLHVAGSCCADEVLGEECADN